MIAARSVQRRGLYGALARAAPHRSFCAHVEPRLDHHRRRRALLAAIAFIPLLGWANWLIIPLAVIGAGIGAASNGKAGRNLNLFVIVVGIIRLMIGGGIF